MSKISLAPDASGSGIFTIASPNSNTNRTLTLPDDTGTIITSGTAGTVLQVVSATSSTEVIVTNQTFTDTTLTASITPTSASSKILVLVTQPVRVSTFADGHCNLAIDLYRGASKIWSGGADSSGGYTFGMGTSSTLNDFQMRGVVNITILDSPATTSATTYKTQVRNGKSGGTAIVNYGSTSYPISTIVLMEIAA
jgi:hypothetical protein